MHSCGMRPDPSMVYALILRVSEMQSDIHAHLQRLATLLVSATHAFEVESGVLVVCEVASPKVNLHSLGLERDIAIQRRIEVL